MCVVYVMCGMCVVHVMYGMYVVHVMCVVVCVWDDQMLHAFPSVCVCCTSYTSHQAVCNG